MWETLEVHVVERVQDEVVETIKTIPLKEVQMYRRAFVLEVFVLQIQEQIIEVVTVIPLDRISQRIVGRFLWQQIPTRAPFSFRCLLEQSKKNPTKQCVAFCQTKLLIGGTMDECLGQNQSLRKDGQGS